MKRQTNIYEFYVVFSSTYRIFDVFTLFTAKKPLYTHTLHDTVTNRLLSVPYILYIHNSSLFHFVANHDTL